MPCAPALRPSRSEPAAWAASSTTGIPSSASTSRIGGTLPNRSTRTAAFVAGVSAARTVSTVTTDVAGSTSQNTGRAPASAIATALA